MQTSENPGLQSLIPQEIFRTIVAALAEPWALNVVRAAIPPGVHCHPGPDGNNDHQRHLARVAYRKRAQNIANETERALIALGIKPLPAIRVDDFIMPYLGTGPKAGYPQYHAEAARDERRRLVADVLSLALVPLCRDALQGPWPSGQAEIPNPRNALHWLASWPLPSL